MSTFNITSVQTKQNLAVDRSKDDVVTLCGANPSEKLQQWMQTKTSTGILFKNLGSGGYLCPDKSTTNPDGVCVSGTQQFVWSLLAVKKEGSDGTHYTIRPFGSEDNTQNIAMEGELKPVKLKFRTSSSDDKYLWDIVSLG